MILSETLVTILFGAFVLLFTVSGYRKGLMIKLLSWGSVIAALIVEVIMYPRIMGFLSSLTQVREIYSRIGRKILGETLGGVTSQAAALDASPLYSLLGLDTLAENAGQKAGEIAAGIICFILIFIAIRIGVRVLIAVARGARKIRVVRWLDGIGGAVCGAAESIVYIWLIMLLVSAFPENAVSGLILDGISRGQALTYLYHNNLILLFFAGMLTAA